MSSFELIDVNEIWAMVV